MFILTKSIDFFSIIVYNLDRKKKYIVEDNNMVKIIIGVKGTGKTKTLIEMINSALESSNGSVVCIEKGENLRLTLSHKCRLINSDEYMVNDAQELYGFIAGLIASNHDITDLFVDATFRICQRDLMAFDKFVTEVDELAAKYNVNLVMTLSMPTENATDNIKKYL